MKEKQLLDAGFIKDEDVLTEYVYTVNDKIELVFGCIISNIPMMYIRFKDPLPYMAVSTNVENIDDVIELCRLLDKPRIETEAELFL